MYYLTRTFTYILYIYIIYMLVSIHPVQMWHLCCLYLLCLYQYRIKFYFLSVYMRLESQFIGNANKHTCTRTCTRRRGCHQTWHKGPKVGERARQPNAIMAFNERWPSEVIRKLAVITPIHQRPHPPPACWRERWWRRRRRRWLAVVAWRPVTRTCKRDWLSQQRRRDTEDSQNYTTDNSELRPQGRVSAAGVASSG